MEARGTRVLELTEDLTEVFLQCFQVQRESSKQNLEVAQVTETKPVQE